MYWIISNPGWAIQNYSYGCKQFISEKYVIPVIFITIYKRKKGEVLTKGWEDWVPKPSMSPQNRKSKSERKDKTFQITELWT